LHALGPPYLTIDFAAAASGGFLSDRAPYAFGTPPDFEVPSSHYVGAVFLDYSPAMQRLGW
jgi:hypothetical protein